MITITRYGFVIDAERCIGCHGCTVACKAEHDVPIGVNRTWVKYVERGTFPDTTRRFTVTRCNHCEDSPCTEICPVSALRERDDGIVDFDPERCLGCKSCLQACPYDSLFINPDTGTSEKCNFCSNRIDRGRKPACVVLCPEDAILAGDLDDPDSAVSRKVAEEPVTVRKPEKGTDPKLYYVGGDDAALDPGTAEREASYLWSQAPQGETAEGPLDAVDPEDAEDRELAQRAKGYLDDASRRVYDTAQNHSGAWGWHVYTYTWLKSAAAGAFLVPALLGVTGAADLFPDEVGAFALLSLVLLGLSGTAMLMELGNPQRAHWILLRPNWSSWLTRGTYLIAGYGGLLGLGVLAWLLGLDFVTHPVYLGATGALAASTSSYSALLFGQAKGRDLWQTPTGPVHYLSHALLAGGAVLGIAGYVADIGYSSAAAATLWLGIVAHLLLIGSEFLTTHATDDAEEAAAAITDGDLSTAFWAGGVGLGVAVPLIVLSFTTAPVAVAAAGGAALAGLLAYEYCWITAPQTVALS